MSCEKSVMGSVPDKFASVLIRWWTVELVTRKKLKDHNEREMKLSVVGVGWTWPGMSAKTREPPPTGL